MRTNWLKPNLYVVQNGQLVVRSTTPQKNRKNYRYVPYDPVNNPGPEDYFRETISRLQAENRELKNQVQMGSQQMKMNNWNANFNGNPEDVQSFMQEILLLKNYIAQRDRLIQEKDEQLMTKDKKLLQVGNENTKLHLKICNVQKQVDSLKKVICVKNEQIMNKKQQIEKYCKNLQRLMTKQKEDEKTNASQNYLATPRVQQKEQDIDQFYSFDNLSVNDRSMREQRYMTPVSLSIQQINQYHQDNSIQRNFNSAKHQKSSNVSSFLSFRSREENIDLKQWSEWANQNKNRSIMALESLDEHVDPLMGRFSYY